MKFGEVAIDAAVGSILAHKLYDDAGKLILNKGHVIVESDLARLRLLGRERIIVTQLSSADLHEDAAAERIGAAVAGANVRMRAPGVGRANLTAAERGVLHVDASKLELINNIYDGITIATLREYSLVDAGDMVALVKVVPFGVPEARVVDVERIAEASGSVLQVRPLLRKRVALIVSGTNATRERLLRSFHAPVKRRIEGWGSELLEPVFTGHDEVSIATAIGAQASADMILVASISAIIDREDVVPSALLRAGGSITVHGVPVDPGNAADAGLSRRGARGWRAGVHQVAEDQRHRLDPAALAQRRTANAGEPGVDGTRRLAEGHRRAPDAAQPDGGLRMAVFGVFRGAIILAAGLSSRMVDNKVLLPWRDGQAIVGHVAAKYLQAGIETVLIVTGRDAAQVRAVLAPLKVTCVHNPDYVTGEILSSVKVGLGALPVGLAATFLQPADMPCIPVEVITQLAQEHKAGWNLAPRYAGRRGHPVLLDRAYWRAMLDLPAGAMPREALRDSRLRLVDVEDGGVLVDVDTRAAYERALGRGCS